MKKQKEYNSELSMKINLDIRQCSKEKQASDVKAFDDMCNAFKKATQLSGQGS